MAFVILRRFTILKSTTNPLLSCKFSTSRASKFVGHDRAHSVADQLHLSPLFSETGKNDMKNCKIELVDDATWNVSSSLADDWRGNNGGTILELRPHFSDQEYDDDDGRIISSVDSNKNEPDFDEIEDMRIRGKLFYKLDKGSKEYEECKFDFHRRKGSRGKSNKEDDTMAVKTDPVREIKKNKERKLSPFLACNENEDSCIEKKQRRSLTFNQLTAPYHEPFCLDIYISNSSVRASIIHRATSNVVASSHSISKDMKIDLGSTKNRDACAAVGKVLAQTALADDIHNVVYTPRRGERLEGKLEIVLKSIVDGGVDVKVKLKQKKTRRFVPPITRGQD